jgi:hypothetical protein
VPIEQRILQLCEASGIPLRMNGNYCLEIGGAEARELFEFCQRTIRLLTAEGELVSFEQWLTTPFTVWGFPIRWVESPSSLAVVRR